MTFVDSNVIMYAVGKAHPLQPEAREFFLGASQEGTSLCISAEVLQEILHVYKSTNRVELFVDALDLVKEHNIEVWSLEAEDVVLGRQLHDRYPFLSARDLCHLASCQRRGVREIKTFDQGFLTAVE